ncbi:MAG: methyltransferase domain-containing protein [Bryobacterales bacterium]|nr:methyltransferase domain-containing protein [Bryobacterales bacterium]
MRLFAQRMLRRLLKELDQRIQKHGSAQLGAGSSNGRELEIETLLRAIVPPAGARAYLDQHLQRLVRTLSLIPPDGGAAVELGSYLHGAAVLSRALGYRDVRGAYYSPHPGQESKTLAIRGQGDFTCTVDLFDAERHEYPYVNNSVDVILCCELIEHLVRDPMHMLFECHRVLVPNGTLVITTPNATSLVGVARTLHGHRNPQIFSAYPAAGNRDTPHVREYTPRELSDAVTDAGFRVDALFTEPIAGFEDVSWAQDLLHREGFDTTLRGEQLYCVASKSDAPQTRYPGWLYAR